MSRIFKWRLVSAVGLLGSAMAALGFFLPYRYITIIIAAERASRVDSFWSMFVSTLQQSLANPHLLFESGFELVFYGWAMIFLLSILFPLWVFFSGLFTPGKRPGLVSSLVLIIIGWLEYLVMLLVFPLVQPWIHETAYVNSINSAPGIGLWLMLAGFLTTLACILILIQNTGRPGQVEKTISGKWRLVSAAGLLGIAMVVAGLFLPFLYKTIYFSPPQTDALYFGFTFVFVPVSEGLGAVWGNPAVLTNVIVLFGEGLVLIFLLSIAVPFLIFFSNLFLKGKRFFLVLNLILIILGGLAYAVVARLWFSLGVFTLHGNPGFVSIPGPGCWLMSLGFLLAFACTLILNIAFTRSRAVLLMSGSESRGRE